MTGDWRLQAACRGLDPDLFFPERAESKPVEALAVCARCEVCSACLADALATNEEFGVRGGTSPMERRRMRTGWKRQRAAHGTRSRYQRGCHCDACTAANTAYEQRRRGVA